jgi:hypothetical protein
MVRQAWQKHGSDLEHVVGKPLVDNLSKIKGFSEQEAALHDWTNRNGKVITIGDETLEQLFKKETPQIKSFEDKDALAIFFKEHLLLHMPEEKRDAAAVSIIPILHQGGLLVPTSSYIQEDLKGLEVSDASHPAQPTPSSKWSVVFKPTSSGFSIQQEHRSFRVTSHSDPSNPIEATPGSHLFKASTTIDVNLTDPNKPDIALTESSIEFGKEPAAQKIKSLIDKRGAVTKLFDRIIDFLKERISAFIERVDKKAGQQTEMVEVTEDRSGPRGP